MNEAQLLIDIGNSRIKWIWAEDGRLQTDRAGQGDFTEFEQACRPSSASRPVEVLLSSVAGAARAQQVAAMCTERWDTPPRLLSARGEQGGVRNGYADPERLGVDRWLAIVGAVAKYGNPVIVWDLGTAATLDAVDASGQHLGGWILPGPGTMLESLVKGTKLKVPSSVDQAGAIEPGRSTGVCIHAGVLAAQLGALNQFMTRVTEEIDQLPRLLATGGAAGPLLSKIGPEHVHDPWLVFRGMLVD